MEITHITQHILWILPMYTLLLYSMTHLDTTMGNDIARDIHCDITIHGIIPV